jgi:virginiamycin A acetyltransferase
MPEYTAPPMWLNTHVEDSRILVGEYTYFDRQIDLQVFTPEDRIEIGKFCSIAKNVVIFGGASSLRRQTIL